MKKLHHNFGILRMEGMDLANPVIGEYHINWGYDERAHKRVLILVIRFKKNLGIPDAVAQLCYYDIRQGMKKFEKIKVMDPSQKPNSRKPGYRRKIPRVV